MHELSIAMSLIDGVQEEVNQRGGLTVEAIHVKVGALSGVSKDALVSAFELAREGTPFARASLVIEEVKVVVNCPTCREPREIESIQLFVCPVCGTPAGDIVAGRDLQLVALEVAE